MTMSVETQLYRIAHISDLHFSTITWSPTQFFSKRWVGNANLLFRRMKEFGHDQLQELVRIFQDKQIDLLIVTGDLSTTSKKNEFILAKLFLDEIKNSGIEVITLPGNHDQYTKSDYHKQTFYEYFKSSFSHVEDIFSDINLKDQKVSVKKIQNDYWIITLDTSLATPLFSCHGNFSLSIEETLRKVLGSIPLNDKVIIANHFPIFTSDSKQKHLLRDNALRQVLSDFPKVKFYIHGHTHRHSIADLRNAGLPIILDSGCTSHKKRGSWNLIELSSAACDIIPYSWNGNGRSMGWIEKPKIHFTI